MIFCNNYNIPMQPVMPFSKDKHEKFCCCPKCRGETKHQKLRDGELDFEEILSRELHKRK